LKLRRVDVDLTKGLLTIRQTKFQKSRLVPLHASTIQILRRYARFRDQKVALPESDSFFLSARGATLDSRTVEYTFRRLRKRLRWTARGSYRFPRIHDLRHTFICHRLVSWYQQRVDVDNAILALSTYVGHTQVTDTYWYVTGIPELMAHRYQTFRALRERRYEMSHATSEPNFASLLQHFFTDRLIQQRNASARTVSSYRDTFRLLLQFAQKRLHKPPVQIELTDIDARLIIAFLDHLEVKRRNTIRSRNARFAAIRSFLHYAALKDPTALPTIQSVLAIPMKRFEKPLIGYLSRKEIQALIDAPDAGTWCGQRDRAMLATLYNTGARVSELIAMTVGDVVLQRSSSVRIHGKGRKERTVPLWPTTAAPITKVGAPEQLRAPTATLPKSLRRFNDQNGCNGSPEARAENRSQSLPLVERPSRIASHRSTCDSHEYASGWYRHYRHRPMARS
jgi:site-specific recombinase XerD